MSSFEKFSKEDLTKIAELFETMSPSPLKESATLAMSWLKEHDNKFSGFCDGEWLPVVELVQGSEIQDPFTNTHFANIYPPSSDILNNAAKNSLKGQKVWSALSARQTAQYLQKIAQIIEKNQELFAQVECLSSKKFLYRTRSTDVPNLIQSFNYYASWASIRDEYKGWKETGVICVVSEKSNNPTLSISWRISSVLAGGNAVLLLADKTSCLSAFLLAELCHLAGLPPGVLNVLPIDHDALDSLPSVDKIIFNGCYLTSNKYIKMAAEQGVPCEVFRPSKPVVMVYWGADLHSACASILETLFFNDIASDGSCCKVFVQECIKKKFYRRLRKKFTKFLVGTNLTKTHMSCLVSKEQHEQFESNINEAKNLQLEIVEGPDVSNAEYLCCRPTLIFNVPTTAKLFEKLSGPVVFTTIFRTVKESIAMFNCNKYSSQVSVWAERISYGLEVAHKLKTRTVWLNSQNLFDASVVYGGLYKQGSSVEGGKEGFFNHLDLSKSNEDEEISHADAEINLCRTEVAFTDIVSNPIKNEYIYGHHIGGTYTKAGSTTKIVRNATSDIHAYITEGLSSDIHSAVASALGVQPKWEGLNKYQRSQILFKASEALFAKRDQFASELQHLTGEKMQVCEEEVEESVSRIQFWASYADKCEGQLTEISEHVQVLQSRNPVGVIGIQCPDQKPLLSFLTLVIPAIAFGNVVVVISSEKYPVPALKMCEILYASGALSGVINVINGSRTYLMHHLCLNLDVDAVWFSDIGCAAFLYNSCTTHPKKIFNYIDIWNDFNDAKKLKLQLESTLTKAIYVPMGTIFAN